VKPHERINVLLIRAFSGPRHARCEAVWQKFAAAHSEINLRIYNNAAGTPHGECLQKMWDQELARDEDRCVITEFDFLPDEGLAHWPWTELSLREPVQAAEYVTRDPATLKLLDHGQPAPWFVRVSKPLLAHPKQLLLLPGGYFNDPCGLLVQSLRGQQVKLLPQRDHWPGCETPGVGVHLMWSRHYNDPPELRPAGFNLGEIQAAVDKELTARGV
jgi:hypothetical protein